MTIKMPYRKGVAQAKNPLPACRPLLEKIDAFRIRYKLSESRFGIYVFNNPTFLHKIRRGMDIKLTNVMKAEQFMQSVDNNGGLYE